MNKQKLNLKGSKDYLNVVGGFIRHAYFFNKKAFKFVGLKSVYTDNNEQSNVGSLLGVELPQAILLRLNTLDLSFLEKYVSGVFPNESVRNTDEEFEKNGISIGVKGDNDLLEITVRGTFNRLKTSDLEDVLGECPDFDIYSNIEARPLEIKFYLRYDSGHFTYEENLRLISPNESSEFVCVDTIHKHDVNFGYSLEGDYLPELNLNLDASIDYGKLKEIVSYAFKTIEDSM